MYNKLRNKAVKLNIKGKNLVEKQQKKGPVG